VQLLAQIKARGLRIVAVDGVDQDWLAGTNISPSCNAGETGLDSPQSNAGLAEPAPTKPAGLMIEQSVRSGQVIVYPEGDVTVLGSIASGAEVVAGGSIHVYGALRGRAIAGNQENPKARLFCRHFEPELVAINGLYCTAEEIDPALLKQPVQVWLDGNTINMSVME
jgi:septum site-determining protein MinC